MPVCLNLPLRRPIRAGFTLIELLVVIGIIGILSGLVFGGVMLAKRSALKAKTASQIQQLQAACESYRTVTGVYPEGPKNSGGDSKWYDSDRFGPKNDLNTYNEVSTDWPVDTAWAEIGKEMLAQLAGIGTQLETKSMNDAWKHPIRYRPARYYPFTGTAVAGAPPDIDSETPPANDSYQIWSIGPDGLDGGGKDPVTGRDDIVSWPR